MLILSRHPNEAIQIGDDIRIVVVEVRGDKVRIGIEAPGDTAITRGELVERDNNMDMGGPEA